MHILFVCNEYPPSPHGGIGVFTQKLAEALVTNGHQASVIGYDETVLTTQTTIENNVLVRRLAKYTSLFKLSLGKYTLSLEPIFSRKNLSKQLELFIKEIKPDLVESYDWSGPLYSKPSIPLMVRMHGANTAHSYAQHKRVSFILSYFEKKNIQFASGLVAVSNYIGNLTLASLQLRSLSFTTIYNTVDTEQFYPDTTVVKNKTKLLFVGRIHPLKGLRELILCCNILFQENPSLELDIIGDGNLLFMEELKHTIDNSIKHRIHFIGKVPHNQLANYYNKAILLLMPSQSEAFGLTAIEAMACGTTVAITNKASGPEIVTHEQNGILVNFDNPATAATAIKNLVADSEKCSTMSANALLTVAQKFSIQNVLEQNIKLYKEFLNDV